MDRDWETLGLLGKLARLVESLAGEVAKGGAADKDLLSEIEEVAHDLGDETVSAVEKESERARRR